MLQDKQKAEYKIILLLTFIWLLQGYKKKKKRQKSKNVKPWSNIYGWQVVSWHNCARSNQYQMACVTSKQGPSISPSQLLMFSAECSLDLFLVVGINKQHISRILDPPTFLQNYWQNPVDFRRNRIQL